MCAFCSRCLQQKVGNAKGSALMTQSYALKTLKQFGTINKYQCVSVKSNEPMTIVTIGDAGHGNFVSHLSYIVGVSLDTIRSGSVFHLFFWSSYKSSCF